jgi:hypothetical protein
MEKTDRRSDKEPMLKPDALIDRIAPDASEVPDVRVITGFLGKSTRRGHWRLYLTPTLNEYVEFAENDVVHSYSLEADENRLGGTLVWVRRDANLVHTKAVSREAQADFLHGDIVARNLRAAVGFAQLAQVLVHFFPIGPTVWAPSCHELICKMVPFPTWDQNCEYTAHCNP